MAKFTKSRSRKPLVEGQPTMSYSRSYDGTPDRIKISMRMGETSGGNGTWLACELTEDEFDKLIEFRNNARDRV